MNRWLFGQKAFGTYDQFWQQTWQQQFVYYPNAFPRLPGITPQDLAGLSLEEDIESRIVEHLTEDGERWVLKRGPFIDQTYIDLSDQQHWTLLVQGINYLLPPFYQLLTHFDFLPYWRFDDMMVSYAPNGASVGPHYDEYDVFLIQLSGTRHWSLTSKNCTPDNALNGSDLRIMANFDTEHTITCQTGDCLYVPAGMGHFGVSQSDDCMTLSVGYRAEQRSEWLDAFGDWVAQQPKQFWRDNPRQQTSDNGITPHHVPQVQSFFFHSNEQDFQHWFAQHMTQPNIHWLPEPLDQPWDMLQLQDWIKQAKADDGWIRDPACRMNYVDLDNGQAQLYHNGDALPYALDLHFAQQVCNQMQWHVADLRTALQHPTLSDAHHQAILTWLNQSQWHVSNDFFADWQP